MNNKPEKEKYNIMWMAVPWATENAFPTSIIIPFLLSNLIMNHLASMQWRKSIFSGYRGLQKKK